MAACLIFGWFALFPSEYEHLGKHIMAGIGFISNIVLWNESGYFDISADAKPLLHLWSLGIEEQFYFFWPICLWLTWKWPKRFFFYVFLFLVSFGSSLSSSYHTEVEAFFSPLTRMWELFIGAFLAYILFYHPRFVEGLNLKNKKVASALSLAGLLLLAGSFFLISKKSAFPGWWALGPTIGASFLILAGEASSLNRFLLSNRIMVGIGLISYPLYLWHWPLLSFANIVGQTSNLFKFILILGSFLLAWCTYEWIEKPFRFGRIKNPMPVLIASAFVLFAFGLLVFHQDGFRFRQNLSNNFEGPGFEHYGKSCSDHDMEIRNMDLCTLPESGDPDVAVFGDSHAWRYFGALAILDPSRKYAMYGKTGGGESVKKVRANDFILAPSIKTIIFTYEQPGTTVNIEEIVAPWISAGKNVIFIFDNPRLPILPKQCDPRRFGPTRYPEKCILSRETEANKISDLRRQARDLESKYLKQFAVIDSLDYLCNETICPYAENNVYLYDDEAHLSREAAHKVSREVLKIIRNFDRPL